MCPAGATLQGADVSNYQGAITWPSVGVSFAIAKATEGTGFTDADFASNWSGMQAAGVVRGAYHYIHCDIDPTQQAQFFLGVLSSAGGLQAGDLPPALDFEDASCTGSDAVSVAVTWLNVVGKATGTVPLFYTSPGFLNGLSEPGRAPGTGTALGRELGRDLPGRARPVHQLGHPGRQRTRAPRGRRCRRVQRRRVGAHGRDRRRSGRDDHDDEL